jgi:hypothetical protein
MTRLPRGGVAFPVDAAPRLVVLLDSRVRIDGGFVDVDSKLAWMDGAIAADPLLPPALLSSLPPASTPTGKTVLRVTDVSSTVAAFRCDRGPRLLPAFRLQVTGLRGSCIILSPDVECWWSVPPSDLRRGQGGDAKIADDGATIHFPAFGGALTEFHKAEFQEHTTYVVGQAITSERRVPAGTAITAVGVGGTVRGRLTSPLGGRVLLDMNGQPLSVTGVDH